MKCDELTIYDGQWYDKSEVDDAIEELKTAHHKERHEYIRMIADLKEKLEDAKAKAYAESVDAVIRERRLKRALYKACSNWAHHRVFVRFKTNDEAWENVERKCLKKAEEYK